MVMSKIRYGGFFMLMVICVVIISCAKTQAPQNNATVNQANNTPVNVTVLISSHPNLNGTGGVDTISNAGIKGILIYRASTTQFYAYERSCTYDGTTVTNAKVSATNGSFTCKDNVCGSIFTIADGSGGVSHGPATYPLKQYTVAFDGTNTLHITN
jgi:Rieske Fe-S protein